MRWFLLDSDGVAFLWPPLEQGRVRDPQPLGQLADVGVSQPDPAPRSGQHNLMQNRPGRLADVNHTTSTNG
jgi:hypothetical protein